MSITTTHHALSHDTVPAQVARQLLERISERGLRPGDTVDSEVQICKELKVSRGSVREAYRLLAALGVLEIGSGRRPRVLAVNSTALAQIFGHALQTAHATPLHVLELRRGIEMQTAQLAARFASDEQRARLRELGREMRAALHDDTRRMASDLAIHETLAEASGNPLNGLVLTALHSRHHSVAARGLRRARHRGGTVAHHRSARSGHRARVRARSRRRRGGDVVSFRPVREFAGARAASAQPHLTLPARAGRASRQSRHSQRSVSANSAPPCASECPPSPNTNR